MQTRSGNKPALLFLVLKHIRQFKAVQARGTTLQSARQELHIVDTFLWVYFGFGFIWVKSAILLERHTLLCFPHTFSCFSNKAMLWKILYSSWREILDSALELVWTLLVNLYRYSIEVNMYWKSMTYYDFSFFLSFVKYKIFNTEI